MHRPIVFSPTETVKTAIAILADHKHCGCAVVASGGQILGLFNTNLANQLRVQVANWQELPLGEVMEKVVPLSVDQADDPKVVIKLFGQQNLHCLPLVDEGGNCVGMITLKDLCSLASKAIEEAEVTSHKLQETELNLQEAQRLAQIGSWELNLEAQTLTWSAEIYRIFELDPLTAEPSYELFLSCLPPAEAERLHQAYQKHLGDRQPYDITYSLVLADGRLKYLRERCETQFDPEGRPLLSRGTTQDITSSHQAQLTLQKLVQANTDVSGEDFFRELVTYLAQALQVAYVLVGEKKAGYAQTLGFWTPEGLQENIAYDYAHPPCQKVLEQGEFSCGAEVQSLLPQDLELGCLGSESYLGLALKNSNNEAIGFLCIWGHEHWSPQRKQEAFDIMQVFAARAGTELERQQINQRLREINQDLEAKVAARTEELAKLASLQQMILDSTDYAIISTDLRGRIQTFNSGAEKMLGYRAEEVVGKATPELFAAPQEMIEHLKVDFGTSPLQVLMEQSLLGLVQEQEWTNIRKDGSRFPISLSISPLRNGQEEVIGFLGISKDLSRQKGAERENLRLQERLKFILSASPAVLFTCQTSGNYDATFVSENIENITGYSVEEFLHIPNFWAERIHPEDAPRVFKEINQLFEQDHHSHEYRFRLADGSYAWMRNQLHLVRDGEGKPLEIVGYLADISAQKKAELSEAQSNALLAAISKAQAQFITAANRLTIFEGLLESLLDLTNSEYGFIGEVLFRKNGSLGLEEALMKIRGVPYLKTHSITNIAWDETTRAFYEANYEQGMEFTNMETLFGAVIMTGKAVIANHPQSDPRAGGIPQGHPPLNAFLGLPFFQGSHLLGMVGIANRPGGYSQELIDYLQPFLVTCSNLVGGYRIEKERKATEEELSRTNEELIRATRLKDEFLANMSHELRTPLNAILVNTQVLQEQIYGDLNAKQLHSLNTVEKSGEHLLDLINEILDLAKIESGQMILQPSSISLTVLCESSLAFVRQQGFKKRLQITSQIPSYCPSFWGDERRLRQALINLLSNAVKFTPEGGRITLTVSIEQTASPSPWLSIAVADTGIGITKADQSKLFQPFRQIDSALNRKYEGTGLGLVLVSRIAALHGGRVEVTSEVGKGSCFTLLLPWNIQNWQGEALKLADTQLTPLPEEPALPLILMINPDLASTESLTNYLEAKHYQLQTVADWDGAIAVLKETSPALILVNLQSSRHQQEGVQRLRQLPQGSRIPLLALIAADGDRRQYLTWGIDECLSRPFKLTELAILIEKTLNPSS